jgi:hypothetical protein
MVGRLDMNFTRVMRSTVISERLFHVTKQGSGSIFEMGIL